MAYAYIWPVTLPQKPNVNYSETSGTLIIRTSTDAGPAKMRRRGARTNTLQVSFEMSTAQVEILREFTEDTLKGVTRFGFTHPRTNEIVEVRIVPQQDGELYSINYILPEYWRVNMQLEVLP
jgi:hypothetical protein